MTPGSQNDDPGAETTVMDGSATMSSRMLCGNGVVTVSGELDVYTAPAFRDRLAEAAARSEADVVCDLSTVSYFDSTTIGVLVGALKNVCTRPGQRQLRVVAPTDPVRKVLQLTGLDQVIPVYATVADALAARAPAQPQVKDTSP
ncbi:STAS domain-containing protein [Streptomyces sp. CAU 1734]|uniref:STAS domain-containing protein n=1 Tax=Streptomyces sp. CAU 1734 TaxID=3140360 RepID=UPI0032600442